MDKLTTIECIMKGNASLIGVDKFKVQLNESSDMAKNVFQSTFLEILIWRHAYRQLNFY